MNSYLQVGVTLGGTLVINAMVAVYVYGKLTQKVADLTSWSKKHDADLNEHTDKLFNHEGRIAHLEGRKGMSHGS